MGENREKFAPFAFFAAFALKILRLFHPHFLGRKKR
jgi:hypothetical protein